MDTVCDWIYFGMDKLFMGMGEEMSAANGYLKLALYFGKVSNMEVDHFTNALKFAKEIDAIYICSWPKDTGYKYAMGMNDVVNDSLEGSTKPIVVDPYIFKEAILFLYSQMAQLKHKLKDESL